VGGIGKGHMVREIDALGGLMGKLIDVAGVQYRMLNTKKGPAVQAPRAQADKVMYRALMKQQLEKTPHLEIKQGTCEEVLVENGEIVGIVTKEGLIYRTKTLVITSGTFMRGLIHMGDVNLSGGRAGDPPSVGLSSSLEKIGIQLGRLKTGTPVRVNRRSVDFSKTEEQPGDAGVYFSFDPLTRPRLEEQLCYICHTTAETKKIIKDNLHRSPLYSGKIVGVGPRYCPSIEDKMVRFAEKERHQIFLEPEGHFTEEMYVNGLSSSLPAEVQYDFIRSIPALENAEIMRPGYAIEYDFVTSGQIQFSLESTTISGLFFAGQVNGTTGYEEAAAQGLIGGINAAQKAQNKTPLLLKRSDAYIGVMIDDLITKGIDEPYRMFTSRAEYRLLLRQDNADLRLRRKGHDLGLINSEQMERLIAKETAIQTMSQHLQKTHRPFDGKSTNLAQLLARPEISYSELQRLYPNDVPHYPLETAQQIELNIKYSGYITREAAEVAKLAHIDDFMIPVGTDFMTMEGLRTEAKLRLSKALPQNLGTASRIPGIAPSDISVLMIALSKRRIAPSCLTSESIEDQDENNNGCC